MSDTVISIENLSKKYIIGHQKQERYTALRDVIANQIKSLSSLINPNAKTENPAFEEFWALKDISFEIKQGDRVGIIGRNGAGKSTLLKILSRITEPTKGCIKIKGRVASLLEVGTGFHGELTGRENIFLNGAILGMSKSEIKRKFDEIVDFSEVEKFLDTPVKRYSSGMYVRLAFAVAAHLEPDILIVDEVLAVGDAQFQKKCLGKMEDVAEKEGRTVLFVSHNMQAIQSLCTIGIYLKEGKFIGIGNSHAMVAHYLSATSKISSSAEWNEEDALGNSEIQLLAILVCSDNADAKGIYSSHDNLYIDIKFIAKTTHPALCIGFDLLTQEGITVFRSYQSDVSPHIVPRIKLGLNHWRCTIPSGLLNGGTYYIYPRIGMHNLYWIINSTEPVAQFEVVLDHGVSPLWNSINGNSRKGIIAPIFNWNSIELVS
ncbi:polysaccharide ABC transporter ATP-binding protein [Anabaena cylindrica UHCC 0172]|uniref:ABC transporter ATP-binding protein n=1 Tax=Anabaena cylindrica TaxID=1165 RepID=UPI002B1F1AEE|nr:polysaccharide ABC transporter ATP-binding protein [Anabaena cylindrica]MEA5553496.1 polysaccharide ABC transporter ATP-binding protein [Anabaena cylindrica UHCC 0172]